MEQFGKYELIRRIGTGGMAEVFLARTTVAQGLAKQLVIKKIHPAFARSRQFVAMFVDEAKIALGLNHPNIVQVFDFGAVGETYFLAMEYVEGLDLLRLIQQAAREERRLPLGLAAYIVQQAAKGLDYAHRKTDDYGEPLGIVHRDISPQNILVSLDGAVKIVDFGIARARDVHEEEGVIKGKFAYMSPEQAQGEAVDHRSDVFSAGVVLFELVCGRPLFPGKGKEVLQAVRSGAIPRPRAVQPEVPEELEQTILKALTFHRDDRYQTARDLQNALGRFQFAYARERDELIDSGALAQFVASVVPADKRRRNTLPPSATLAPASHRPHAPTGASQPGRPLDTGSDLDRLDDVAPAAARANDVRERKHVFVLEGHICGLAALERRAGSHRAGRALADFFQVARDIAYKHDAIAHHTGEGDLTFVVGLPVASEDDPTRALRLALALVDALDGIGADVDPELRLAVGIQQGVAVLERKGGRKFTYELAESTTTIARRLAREAQGAEVLVGGRVYRVARDEWSFEELTTIDLVGEPDTQPGLKSEDTEPGVQRARVYRLRGPKERAERMRERAAGVHLVGRQLELKALVDAYRDVLVRRRKHQILVVGDAGVGKRTLVNAFLAMVPKGEAIVLRATARVATAYTPFAVLADLGRDLLGLAEGAAPREVQKRLERVAPLLFPGQEDSREVRGLMQAVGMLFGVELAEGGGDIDAAERRQRIIQALLRIEQRFSGDKPLIVVGEDTHWCDDETLDVFRELLRVPSARPILGIVTARPDPRVRRTAEEVAAQILPLHELNPDERLYLVTSRFVPDEDVRELGRQILARAGGNPFFIGEMLDALVERGIVVAEPPGSAQAGLLRWVQRDVPIQVPTSVEALLAARFDRLPQPEKEVLMHAAVLGRAFAAEEVGRLLGRRADEQLGALVERGLLSRDGASYVFQNDMTMTVAYGLLAADDRARLHRVAAEHIQTAPTYRRGQDDAVVARHLELAGDVTRAAERYLDAAAHAVDVGGNADAFRQLTRALKILPAADHHRRFVARRQREEILRRMAQRPKQLREIHNLLKEAEALGDAGKIAMAHARLAQFYIDVGKAPAAARSVVPALEFARKAGDRLAEAEALRLRAAIARLVGNNEESLALCEQALGLCNEERDGLLQRATILNGRGTTLWNMGRLHEAIESYAEALVIYRMLELPRQETRALNNMGIVFAALGEYEEALAHYKSSLKLDQDLGDRGAIALKLGNIGQTYCDLGDTDRAERYLCKALELADQMGDRSSATDVSISLGQVYLQRRDYRRAHEHLDRGLQLASDNRDRYQEIRALVYLALTQVERGDPPEGALELAQSATKLARKMPMPIGEIYGMAVQGLALAALGRKHDAAELAGRAVALQDAMPQSEGAEQILHIYATLCEQAGRLDLARKAIERAAAEVETKAGRLQDPQLRQLYLAAKVPRAIAADAARLAQAQRA